MNSVSGQDHRGNHICYDFTFLYSFGLKCLDATLTHQRLPLVPPPPLS